MMNKVAKFALFGSWQLLNCAGWSGVAGWKDVLKHCSKMVLPSLVLVMTIFSNLQKMVNGGVVNHWACLNFSRSVQENVASAFCAELAHMCQTSGMVLCWIFCSQFLHWVCIAAPFIKHSKAGMLLYTAGFSGWTHCPSSECAPRACWACSVTPLWRCEEKDKGQRLRSSCGHSAWQQWITLWYVRWQLVCDI